MCVDQWITICRPYAVLIIYADFWPWLHQQAHSCLPKRTGTQMFPLPLRYNEEVWPSKAKHRTTRRGAHIHAVWQHWAGQCGVYRPHNLVQHAAPAN